MSKLFVQVSFCSGNLGVAPCASQIPSILLLDEGLGDGLQEKQNLHKNLSKPPGTGQRHEPQ